MTEAISAGSRPPPPPPSGGSQATEEQLTELEELLEEYDASSLSDDEAAELVAGIQELGIRPSKELSEALTDAGFDPQALREQAGVAASAPPPPPQEQSGVNEEALAALTQLLEESGDSSTSVQDLLSALSEGGFDTSEKIIDLLV